MKGVQDTRPVNILCLVVQVEKAWRTQASVETDANEPSENSAAILDMETMNTVAHQYCGTQNQVGL